MPHGATREDIRPDRAERRVRLISAIARGRRWLDEIVSGSITDAAQLAKRERCTVRQINLALLACVSGAAAGEGSRRGTPPAWHQYRAPARSGPELDQAIPGARRQSELRQSRSPPEASSDGAGEGAVNRTRARCELPISRPFDFVAALMPRTTAGPRISAAIGSDHPCVKSPGFNPSALTAASGSGPHASTLSFGAMIAATIAAAFAGSPSATK